MTHWGCFESWLCSLEDSLSCQNFHWPSKIYMKEWVRMILRISKAKKTYTGVNATRIITSITLSRHTTLCCCESKSWTIVRKKFRKVYLRIWLYIWLHLLLFLLLLVILLLLHLLLLLRLTRCRLIHLTSILFQNMTIHVSKSTYMKKLLVTIC